MPMKINPKDLLDKYQDLLPYDDPFELFVDDNGELLGYTVKYDDDDESEVISVKKEADINKIGELYPDSVRIGCGEYTPYDDAIIGYVEDGIGNARIVYSYELICESLSKDGDISYDYAVDWVEYNTLGSLPNIPTNVRPYIIYSV